MATVHIPATMRPLTGGRATVTVPGETVREIIEGLEAAYPGTRARLMEGDRLRAGLAVFVDGEVPAAGLRARVRPDSEIHFAPAIAGGAGPEACHGEAGAG